jgi:hypothetical protein
VTFSGIEYVKTRDLKDSDKEEDDRSSPHSRKFPVRYLSTSIFLDPLKDALRGRRFADGDELKHSVREKLRRFGKGFYATGIQSLIKSCKRSVANGEFVEE